MSHGVAALHRSSGWMAVPILLIIVALGAWTAMAVQEVTKDGLLQTFPGKIVKVDLNGVPAGQITIGGNDPTKGGFAAVIDANCRDGKLVLAGVHVSQGQTSQTRTSYLSEYAEDGSEKTRYWDKVTMLDFANFEIIEKDQYFVYPRRWAIGLDGKIYAAPDREN